TKSFRSIRFPSKNTSVTNGNDPFRILSLRSLLGNHSIDRSFVVVADENRAIGKGKDVDRPADDFAGRSAETVEERFVFHRIPVLESDLHDSVTDRTRSVP